MQLIAKVDQNSQELDDCRSQVVVIHFTMIHIILQLQIIRRRTPKVPKTSPC